MPKKKITFIADFFVEDYLGGSEKSLDAILRACPPEYEIQKIHSADFKTDQFQPQKDFLVFGNFNRCSPEALKDVAARFKYAVIESDFKYCRYRLPEMHSSGMEQCTCELDPEFAHIRELYFKSRLNIFKSKRHLERHLKALPGLMAKNNFVLFVTYTSDDLAFLLDLRHARRPFVKMWPWDKPVYGVYDSGNWIKGKDAAVQFCKKNKVRFELVKTTDDKAFQQKLASLHGFVFLPRGLESCSRMVVEAKILGLDVIVNGNVGASSDECMQYPIQDLISYLQKRPAVFWEQLAKVVK